MSHLSGRVAVVLVAVLLAGCATPEAADPPGGPPPSATSSRPAQPIEFSGSFTEDFNLRTGDRSDSLALEGGEDQFEVPAGDHVVQLALSWTSASPAPTRVKLSVGQRSGGMVAAAEGTSPITVEFAANGSGAKAFHILVWPPDEYGAMVAHEFEWHARVLLKS